MTNDFLQQGFRNVNDARFVRDHFIPVARSHERWNLIVYEAHRATELLLRSMICQLGFKPSEHHDISTHVAFLRDHLPGSRHSNVPFTIGAYIKSGEGYGVIIDAVNNIRLFRLENDVLTQLGATRTIELPTEGLINVRFEVDREIRVYFNDACLLATTDSSYTGPFTIIGRSFVRQPRATTVRLLRKLGHLLTKERNPAYYGEQQYSKNEAMHAISYMEESFEIAATFFAFE